MTNVTKITAGLLAGATLAVASTPAEAQYRYRHHRGDDAALAIGAGVLGLAVGAAVASGSRNRGYYGDGYYYDRGYYGRPYAYNGYYGGYYGRPYGYGYGYDYYRAPPRRCWTERQWDEWRGGWRRMRVCNRY